MQKALKLVWKYNVLFADILGKNNSTTQSFKKAAMLQCNEQNTDASFC